MGWEKDFEKFNFYEFMENASKKRRRKKSDPDTKIIEAFINLFFYGVLFILFSLFILLSRKKSSVPSVRHDAPDSRAIDYKDEP